MNKTTVNTWLFKDGKIIPIAISTHIRRGMNTFKIIGNIDSTVREVKQRLQSSFQENGFIWPHGRIIIDLQPSEIHKAGSGFDLPIAISILLATRQIFLPTTEEIYALGSLSLSGDINVFEHFFYLLKNIYADIPKYCFIPSFEMDKQFLTTTKISKFLFVESLKDFKIKKIEELNNKLLITSNNINSIPACLTDLPLACFHTQNIALRALTIALAGNHSLLMFGSPGSGKTNIARLSRFLISNNKAEENLFKFFNHKENDLFFKDKGKIYDEPTAFLEITPSLEDYKKITHIKEYHKLYLAEFGTLFIDELSQYPRIFLDNLQNLLDRLPLYDNYPRLSHYNIIACLNPCPCGKFLETNQKCSCTRGKIEQYKNKLRGSLLDRFHLKVNLTQPYYKNWSAKLEDNNKYKENFLLKIKENILNARYKQEKRNSSSNNTYFLNGELNLKESIQFFKIPKNTILKIEDMCKKQQLSMRSFLHLIQIARTISDLNDENEISENSILEAFYFKKMSDIYLNNTSVFK